MKDEICPLCEKRIKDLQKELAEAKQRNEVFSNCLHRALKLWKEDNPEAEHWPDGAVNIRWLVFKAEQAKKQNEELEKTFMQLLSRGVCERHASVSLQEFVAKEQEVGCGQCRLEEIDRLKRYNRWIPVSEELPEYGENVVVKFGTGNIRFAYRQKGKQESEYWEWVNPVDGYTWMMDIVEFCRLPED